MRSCLFSPIGRTDPVRNNFDGPFLHILRHYPVKKAVLYLTKETYELHRKDDRYLSLARKVSAQTQYTICGDETLVDAQRFEIYDTPFHLEIEKLHRENPDCDVFVNISSGTPQMEASLYLLKAILPFPVRAIQVRSPEKSSNDSEHLGKTEALDLDALYDALLDNAPDAENRCVEVKGENVQAALLKKNILALIQNYNYSAALTLAQSAQELFHRAFLQSLQAAKLRLALETKQATKALSGCFEERRDDLREAYEYILMLDTLVEREMLGDYARAISPALVALLRQALLRLVGLNIYELCTNKGQGAEWHFKKYKIQDQNLLSFLDSCYPPDGLRYSFPLNADVMVHILKYYKEKKGSVIDIASFSQLRDFEKKVRNCAAHQITPITEAQVWKWTDRAMTIPQAQKLLKNCFCQVSGKEYQWDGYKKMNELLADWLEQPL